MDLDEHVPVVPRQYDWLDSPDLSDMEAMTVSAVILAPKHYRAVAGILSDVDFSIPSAQEIWRAIGRVDAAGKPIDVALVWHEVRPGSLTRERFVDIVDSCPNSENVMHYATMVQDAAAKRRMASIRGLLAPSCRPVGEMIAAAQAELDTVRQKMAAATSLPILDLVRSEFTDYQAAMSGPIASDDTITTGIPSLDEECGPLLPGYLVVIGARPSMGKSSLALQIAGRTASSIGPALVFPIETGAAQISRNILSQRSGVSCDKITQRKQMSEAEFGRMLKAAESFLGMKLWVDDTAALTVEQAWGRAAALQSKHGLRLVVVDYLQLLRSSTGLRGRSREQEVAEISRGLKAMARSLNVPVIACAQINRSSEQGEDKRPRLSHLRESGQIEQDADIVILLHRQERYTPDDKSCHGWAEATVAKRKVGRSGGVAKIGFAGESLVFYERQPEPGTSGNPFDKPKRRSDIDG